MGFDPPNVTRVTSQHGAGPGPGSQPTPLSQAPQKLGSDLVSDPQAPQDNYLWSTFLRFRTFCDDRQPTTQDDDQRSPFYDQSDHHPTEDYFSDQGSASFQGSASPAYSVDQDPQDSGPKSHDSLPAETTHDPIEESACIKELRLKIQLETQLAAIKLANTQSLPAPPPGQSTASAVPVALAKDVQVAPPLDAGRIYSGRVPVDKAFVNQLSPVRSPFRRFMGSGRVGVVGSPVPLSSSKPDVEDNAFRTSIKVLLDYMPDVSTAVPRDDKKKKKQPEHFIVFNKTSGKDRILLPAHPNVARNYQFVQDDYVKAKKNDDGSYKIGQQYNKLDIFEPKSQWSRCDKSFDPGMAASFLRRDKTVDQKALNLFDFRNMTDLKVPLTKQFSLSKKAAEAIVRNTKSGIAAASYESHFLEAATTANAELIKEVDNLLPPAHCSKATIEWVDKLKERFSTSLGRSAIFLQGTQYASDFSSAFHVFNDVLEAQFRRDQFLPRLKPYLKHHQLRLRDAPFGTSQVFPELDVLMEEVKAETAAQATIAIADNVTPGWGGRGGGSRSSRQGRSDNRRDSGRGRSAQGGQGQARSNYRPQAGQGDRRAGQDSRDNRDNRDNRDSRDNRDNRDNRGRSNTGSGSYNSSQYRGQSNRGGRGGGNRRQRQHNVPGGSQSQQPKSQQDSQQGHQSK